MNISRFVWTDLSTYDVREAKHFYGNVFGWNFYEYAEGMADEYFIAHMQRNYLAGMYLLPEVFQQKNFPSFWMPYIQVTDINQAVQTAQQFEGVRIEIQPTAFEDGSFISLIRDPLGAGFTIYQGNDLRSGSTQDHGIPCWNELHLSQVEKVKSFYETLFGWQIQSLDKKGEFVISLSTGEPVGNIYEFSDGFRGGYEYWIQAFMVTCIQNSLELVEKADGKVSYSFEDGRVMVRDSQDASFILVDGSYFGRN